MSDWNIIRSQYPVTKNGIYLKSASIGGMNNQVLDEIIKWETSIAHQGAINEMRFGDLVFQARDCAAEILKCEPQQISLTENTSHNFNLVAMMLKEEFPQGAEIVAPADEFPSSILPFYHHGHKLIQVPSQNGIFTIGDLLDATTENTKAVVCSHIQFSSGLRTDIYKLSAELKARGIGFILNATQSIGAFPIDLSQLELMAMSATCHKWLGAGMGRALFYLSSKFIETHRPPILGWCSVAEPFEMKNDPGVARSDVGAYQLGTLPFSALAGVKKALEINREIGSENIAKRILSLSSYLRSQLEDLGYPILGDANPKRSSGTLTFKTNLPSEDIVAKLEERSIYVNNRRGLIRASVHFYNNETDIDELISALREID